MFTSFSFLSHIGQPNVAFFLLLVVVLAVLVVKRLYFHPLSEYPGPRLGAVTTYYKTYFEVCKGGGLLQEINRLHAIHGKHDLGHTFNVYVADIT